jgi:hypothetical protein
MAWVPPITAFGLFLSACSTPSTPDGSVPSDGPADGGCPEWGIRGSGQHRLFVQGHDAPPQADGTWPFLHEVEPGERDSELCDDSIFMGPDTPGHWEPGLSPLPLGPSALVHGEHFLVGPGAFVEITTTLCEDITGDVAFYIPNFDVDGSTALHQLVVQHEGEETLIAEVTDDEPGSSGYNPFVRRVVGMDPDVVPGDRLVLRSINISGASFSVMVWRPPSEYESWILVEVP